MTVDVQPRWGKREVVYRTFGLSRRKLREFALNGWVRAAKLGSAAQAGRVFCLGDVAAVLFALAEGREPRRPPYKATRKSRKVATP